MANTKHNYRVVTIRDRKELASLLQMGLSIRKASAALGITQQTASRHLRAMGLKSSHPQWRKKPHEECWVKMMCSVCSQPFEKRRRKWKQASRGYRTKCFNCQPPHTPPNKRRQDVVSSSTH